MHFLLRYCIKNLSIGAAEDALLNLFWIFEHITAGPFNGLLSATFSHGKSSPKTFGHLYFEFLGINVH